MSALAGGVGTACAQTWLYTGTNYGTGANWTTGITPGAGQIATFNTGGANQPIIGGNFTIGTLNMTAGSLTINPTRTLTVQSAVNLTNASILGGGILSLNAGSLLTTAGTGGVIAPAIRGAGNTLVTGSDVSLTGTNTYTGTTTINSGGSLSLGTGGTTGTLGTGAVTNGGSLLFNRSNALTVSSAISGIGSVSQVGSGTTSLTGDNTYSGTTTITAGVLRVGAGAASGTLGSGAVVNNATLQVNRSDATFTLANNISGSGALAKTTAGAATTLILAGTNSYSGTTTVTEGTIQVGAGGTAGSLGTGAVTATGAGTLSFNRSDDVAVANVISGTGRVTKLAANTLTLTGANTYSGPTTISAGTLQVGAGGTAGDLGTGNVTNNAALAFNRSDAVTYAGVVSGTGALNQTGAGTTSLTGSNTYSGGTTISAGTLSIGTGGTSGALGSGATTNDAMLVFNRSNALTVSSAISGAGTVEKLGAGTTSLTGDNAYSGTTTITAGVLRVGAGAASGTLGSGAVVNNATLQVNRSDATFTLANDISGSGALAKTTAGAATTLILAGTNSYSGTTTVTEGTIQVGAGGTAGSLGTGAVTATGAGTLSFNRSDDVAVANVIAGTGRVTKLAANTLTLTGGNTYSGTTTISAGTLGMGGGGTTGTLGTAAVTNNATLAFNRSDAVTVANVISGIGAMTQIGAGTTSLTGANTYSGTTTIVAGTLSVGAGGTTGTLGSGDVTNNAALAFNRLDAITVANAISGTGTVSQIGNGTTTLTGANTYLGTTTISAGTLQVGNGGTTGTLGTGATVNNGSLVFNRSDILTVASAISGAGSVVQAGTGTTILTGANTYTGPTTISAGRLTVNGSITSNVTVGAGGTLDGSGTIAGSMINSGIVKPGNSIGTLTVNGSFTQTAGSIYQVEVNAAGQSDLIKVVGAPGTATIQGATVQVLAAPGNYARNTTYTILTAAGGVTGTYSNVTSNFAFLTPSLSYDPNNVFLSLLLRDSAFASGAQTSNQRAVGAVLDQANVTPTGDFNNVISALARLSTTQGPAALDAISGQQYAGFGTANLGSGLLFMNAVGQQMSAARGGSGGGNRVALAQACDVACDDEGASPWSLWGSALGGTGSVAGNGNASTLTYNTGGFATGVDYRVDPRFVVGLGLGYTTGSQWVNGFDGRGTSDSYQGSIYASFSQAAFYLDALVGYGYNDNQMTRTIAIPGLQPRTARGRAGASQFLGQAEVGYKLGIYEPALASLTPFARFQTSIVSQSAFAETGASSLNLDVAQQTTTSIRSILGAELATGIDLGWREKLALQLRLGWAHEHGDTARPVTASFAGAPGLNFTVFGVPPQRDSVIIGLAANTAIAEGTSLYLRYDGDIGNGTDSHALSAGIRMSW